MQNPLITVDCTCKSLLYLFTFILCVWVFGCKYVYMCTMWCLVSERSRGHWVPGAGVMDSSSTPPPYGCWKLIQLLQESQMLVTAESSFQKAPDFWRLLSSQEIQSVDFVINMLSHVLKICISVLPSVSGPLELKLQFLLQQIWRSATPSTDGQTAPLRGELH